jgi:hypothetical protein
MTQDEIIAMAKQVGFPIQHSDWQKAVEEFAALIEAKLAAKEREACAKVCEKYAAANTSWSKAAVKDCAAIIKARGKA